MTPEEYEEVRTLYHELADLVPSERRERISGLDLAPDVRRELLELLGREHEMELFAEPRLGALGGLALAVAEEELERPREVPERIGAYAVERVLGIGGMGVVYLALQESPRRRVAIKVLRRFFADPGSRRRFEREAEFLGRLQHPGIAQVVEAGRLDDDVRTDYIVMEFVEGAPITAYADERMLGRDDRIRLLVQLCRSVHHAHSFGVVHRDLKPSNVLVTHEGRVKVIDFGIARAVDGDAALTGATEVGQIVGTLTYMSPEQVLGDSSLVDARSDVYSIGVLAYELFSGSPPHDLRTASLAQAVERLKDRRAPPLGRVAPECRGDVELIVSKALDPDQDRRYQSAAELAADLRRFLDCEPIQARPVSAVYQLSRLARRHRGVVVATAAAFVAILVGAGVALRLAIVNGRLAESAGAASDQANAAKELAERRLAELEVRTGELSEVADFQEAILHAVDATAVGEALRADIRADVLADLALDDAADETRAARRAEVDRVLEHLDATRIAARTLEHAILDPSGALVDERFDDQPRVRAKLLASLARNRANLRLPDTAEAFRRAYEASVAANGADDATSFELDVQLASSLLEGDLSPESPATLAEARERLERGLAGLRSLGVRGDVQRLARVFLARWHSIAGDDERAAEVLEDLVADVVEGEETLEDFVAMRRLGKLHALAGRFEEALPLYRRAAEGIPIVRWADHPAAIVALSDLGVANGMLGHLDEAESQLERALEAGRRTNGDDNPLTLETAENLGAIYGQRGRLEEALRQFRFVLDVARRSGSLPEVLHALERVQHVQYLMKDYAALEETASEAVELVERELGPGAPRVLPSLEYLALAHEGLAKSDVEGDWAASAAELRARIESLPTR